MKHLMFPTVAQADAFVQDLQSQGVIRPEMGSASLNRRSGGMTDSSMASTTGVLDDRDADYGGGTPEDAGAGAVKGTGVGVAVGAVAGVVATVATGGLAAIPVILGMAALGSGVGAGVGAIGGAAGVDETNGTGAYSSSYDVDDEHYDRMNSTVSNGGRTIAVDDSVPHDVVAAAAARHGGEFVQ